MQGQYTPYVLALVIAAVVSVALAILAWPQRQAPIARPFAGLVLAGGGWALGYALELSCADLPTMLFWVKVYYLGIVLVPMMWLILALQYTGQDRWLTRRRLSLLAIMPLVTLLLIWTNDLHGLFWRDVGWDTSGPLPMLGWTYGIWFWVYAVYSNLVLLFGTLLILQAFVRSPRPYRSQAAALLISALVPWIANAIYMFGWSPFHGLDLTPFAFSASGVVIAWSLLRFRFLNIVPVARDAVIENLNDGVIVLDVQDRIVDMNPAAGRIVGRSASEAIGQPAAQVLPNQSDLIGRCHDVVELHTEVVLGERAAQRTFDLRISALRDRRGRLAGRMIVLHDISDRKRVEEKLRYLSTHDVLTGLYNRAYFEEELARLGSEGRFPLSVIMADANGLKATNDSLGHAAGDELLRRAATVLRVAFRTEAVVTRIGGDEFAVFLPGVDATTVADALARVRNRLQAHNDAYDGPPLNISLGAATAETSDLLAAALKQADAAMYRDKFAQAGRPPADPPACAAG
jgi:diguanylate cyclase (GGDEF)-like protein/PAS domain S-box-containing protein